MSTEMIVTICGQSYNLSGVIVGAVSFVAMSFGHWACIKGEYYCSKRIWIAFCLFGILFCGLSLFCENLIIGSSLSILGMILLWGIGEVIQQEKRVEKGWFPKNPKREK